eukprot:7337256-Pyramimonas_sp.AAC.1
MTLKLKSWQQFRKWIEGQFHYVALALAPRTFVLFNCKSFQVEGGLFSKRGSRVSAAHIRSKSLQELH